jgi:hypothetical protein
VRGVCGVEGREARGVDGAKAAALARRMGAESFESSLRPPPKTHPRLTLSLRRATFAPSTSATVDGMAGPVGGRGQARLGEIIDSRCC